MSRGRKSKSESNILNSQQTFNKNVGIYFQAIIIELGKCDEIGTENAADLFKKIVIGRKKIGKKGKESSPISLKEIPFKIPKNWIWCRLGDIIQFADNLNIETNLSPDTLINYVDIEAIDNLNYKIRESKLKPVSELSSRARRVLRKGYMVYSLVRPYLNNVAIIEEDKDNYIGSTGFTVFDGILVNNSYLKYVLLSDYVRKLFLEMLSGFNSPTITQEQFISTPIPLPPLSEQNKIVDFISNFENEKDGFRDYFFNEQIEDKIIELHESQLIGSELQTELKTQSNLLSKLRQAYLQEAVMGKLTEPSQDNAQTLLKAIKSQKAELIKQGKLRKEKPLAPIKPEEIPFEIPDNWVWCRLGEICHKITDGTHHSPTNIENGDFKYITAKNIKSHGIDLSNITFISREIHNEIYSRCNPTIGDILYIKDGATTGVVTINNIEEEFSMLSSVALFKTSPLINNEYLVHLLRSPFIYKLIRNDMSGVAITRVTLQKINNFPIPLPPLSEQKAIVAKVEGLLGNISLLESENTAQQIDVQRLMGAVLQEAFGGR